MQYETIKHYTTLHGARIAAAYYNRTAKFSRVNVFKTNAKTKTGRLKKTRNGTLTTVYAVYLKAA